MSKLELIQEIENKSNIGHVHSDLNEQIETLSNTRGYLSTRQIEDNTDFNDIPKLNGIYMISTRTNAPVILEYNQWYFVRVTVHNDLYLTQEAWTFASEKSQRWVRTLYNNVWQPWIQIADTEQINALSTTHGYINSKKMQDFNACVKNGKYTISFIGDGVEQHAPSNIWVGENTFSVDVTQEFDNVLTQEICGIYGANQGRKFYRVHTFGTWTDWKEMATTTKTDILFPYSSGFEKVYSTDASGVSKCNNFVTVNLNVIKSDNTEITSHDIIAVLPSGYRPPKTVFNTCFDGRYVKTVGVVVRDNGYVQTTSYIEGLKTLVGQISFYTE